MGKNWQELANLAFFTASAKIEYKSDIQGESTMAVFNELLNRRGKAEEDLYFAKEDRKLLDALHEKQDQELNQQEELNDIDDDIVGA